MTQHCIYASRREEGLTIEILVLSLSTLVQACTFAGEASEYHLNVILYRAIRRYLRVCCR